MAGVDNTARNAEIIRRLLTRVGPTAVAREMGLTKAVVANIGRRAGLTDVDCKPLRGVNSPIGRADPTRADRVLRRFSFEASE